MPSRDLGLSTRLLLMLEVHNGKHTRQRTLAEKLDITVQAVSDALRRLTEEGLVHNEKGTWKPTPKGTDWLHRHVLDLKLVVQDALGRLEIIKECIALASSPIRAGETVGLFMREGQLWAEAGRRSRSKGVAANSAQADGLVHVKKLEGIVELKPGTIHVLGHATLPDAEAETAFRRHLERLEQARIAVHDAASRAFIHRLGRRPDLEFAPTASAIDAASRGVDVLYLVPHVEAPAVLAELSEAKDAEGEPLRIRTLEA
jgi:putative transcriptional regulator